MQFFGDYIRGNEPLIDNDKNNKNNKKASIQNGYYLQIVGDNVKRVGLDDLNETKERCKVWEILGVSVYKIPQICLGVFGVDESDWESYDITEKMEEVFGKK
eukprot:470713_1